MKFESIQRFVIKPDFGLLLLRVGLGAIMAAHGVTAIMNGQDQWKFMGSQLALLGIDFYPLFWGFMAAISMAVGGFFVVIGYLYRISCFLIFLTMLMAFLFHLNSGDGMLEAGGQSLKMCLAFLAMMFVGPGRFSVQGSGGSV